LPVSQEHLLCGEVSYYGYEGIFNNTMQEGIRDALGPKNKILILRNHGVAVCGSTIEEAWMYLSYFMLACNAQFHAMAAAQNIDDLIIPEEKVLHQVQKMLFEGVSLRAGDQVRWNLGEIEFEAEMRRLDYMVTLNKSKFFWIVV
jgi:adducin